MMAAGSTELRSGVYAGSPAEWRREVHGDYFESTSHVMTEFVIDGEMGPDDTQSELKRATG
jgi:hypothetical protein